MPGASAVPPDFSGMISVRLQRAPFASFASVMTGAAAAGASESDCQTSAPALSKTRNVNLRSAAPASGKVKVMSVVLRL